MVSCKKVWQKSWILLGQQNLHPLYSLKSTRELSAGFATRGRLQIKLGCIAFTAQPYFAREIFALIKLLWNLRISGATKRARSFALRVFNAGSSVRQAHKYTFVTRLIARCIEIRDARRSTRIDQTNASLCFPSSGPTHSRI